MISTACKYKVLENIFHLLDMQGNAVELYRESLAQFNADTHELFAVFGGGTAWPEDLQRHYSGYADPEEICLWSSLDKDDFPVRCGLTVNLDKTLGTLRRQSGEQRLKIDIFNRRVRWADARQYKQDLRGFMKTNWSKQNMPLRIYDIRFGKTLHS